MNPSEGLDLERGPIARLALLLVGSALLEAALLHEIVFHPAGGWSSPEDDYLHQVVISAIPFVAAAVVLLLGLARKLNAGAYRRPLMVIAISGPVADALALNQYGHAAPLLITVGLVIQGGALVVAARALRGTT